MEDLEYSKEEAASLFDVRSQDVFSNEDRQLLAQLLSRRDRVDLAVPDGIAANDLWSIFDLCSRAYLKIRAASGQLKLLIGRALAVIQETPEVYESRGFRSFEAFISDETRGIPAITGISRSELYKAKAVAKAAGPDMTLQDAKEIGFTKMAIITGVSQSGDSRFGSLIEAAKTDTIPQLRERVARMGFVGDPEEIEWDVLQLNVTKAQKRFIQGFLENPQVKAYCESQSPGTILERLVAECSEEWQIRAMVIEGEARDA